MKAALLYGVRDLRIVDSPMPDVRPQSVLLKVHACGVCPTDIRKYGTLDGAQAKLPMNLGHEFVGTVIKIGPDVRNFELGMRVMGDGYVGYAEYALLDLSLQPPIHAPTPVIIPQGVSDAAATFAEPLGCCVHAVMDQAKVQADQTVVIIGGGTMGQLLLLAAKSVGARVILSEPYAERRDMALSLGADTVIDPQIESLSHAVRTFNDNNLADATILSIGNPSSVQPALETVRPGGSLVLFGRFLHGIKIEIDPAPIYRQEVQLLGSYWAGGSPTHVNANVFRMALDLIESGRAPVERLISDAYSLSRIHEAFAAATRMDRFKIIVRTNEEMAEEKRS